MTKAEYYEEAANYVDTMLQIFATSKPNLAELNHEELNVVLDGLHTLAVAIPELVPTAPFVSVDDGFDGDWVTVDLQQKGACE